MKTARVPASTPARVTIWALGIFAIVQGFGMCVGGIGRWSGEAYTVIRLVPGSPYTWGVWLMLSGVTVLIASLLRKRWLKTLALSGIGIWAWCFSMGAFGATFTVQTAGTTGGPAYMLIAVLAAILINIDESSPPCS